MDCQLVSQLACRSETIFRFVLNGSHQDLFHLCRDTWSDLPWPRILRKIKDQEWVILWVSSRQ